MRETTEVAAKTLPKRVFKKSNAAIVKLEKEGDKIEGKYLTSTTGPWTDPKTGELKELTRLHFVDDRETKFILFQDGGLKNAMANANVKEGDYIQIVYTGQADIGQGRRVNNYDIYHAE